MASVGWSTLDVIPSVKNLAGELDKQTRGPLAAAGRTGGRQFGDAAGREASTRFGASLKSGLRTVAAPFAGILAGLGGVRIFGDMIAEAQEAAKVTKVTEQLVRTTGGAANVTASQVGNLATKLSQYAAVDDELVQSGENVLLTFRNVRNEMGAGNDIFNRATKAALDLSTVMGTDFNGAAMQLGKALQDPIRGLTMLGRAGVQFSEDQKAQIKAFVASNDLLSAQKVVLGELEHQVGGAAGANATSLDRLQVSFKNLEEAAGTALLPVLNTLADTATNQVIPAIEGIGGSVGDAAQFFGSLPPPVKAATGALVAFRAAQSLGAGGILSGSTSLLSRGLDDVRLRAMALTDEYKRLRQGQLDIIQGSGQFTPAAGRMASALGAVELAAIGAGRSIVSGLRGALNLVGGPWGAAFIAGTAIVAKFWQGHQEAKARVDSLTESLNEQTGAITDNTRAQVIDNLQKNGALDLARKLGLSLELVTDAALGNKDATVQANAALDGLALGLKRSFDEAGRGSSEMVATSTNIEDLRRAIGGQAGELSDAASAWRNQSEAMGDSATATKTVARSTAVYTTTLKNARKAVQDLLDKENERRNKNLGAFQDQTRLAQALADANKEAKEGKKTLDASSEAGRKNREALAGLADAWNSAADKVKNAKGAYADMRQNFIDVATAMGGGDKSAAAQAKRLADRLLGIPPKTPVSVTTPGMDAALAKVRELREELRKANNLSRIVITAQAAKNQGQVLDAQAHASGGLLTGPGSGTSDSILMWGSNGEFMQRKAAVDYYGVDFMRKVNSMQFPRYASGGPVGSAPASTAPLGHELVGTLRIAADGVAFIEGVARQTQDSAEAARLRARRAASIGGLPG